MLAGFVLVLTLTIRISVITTNRLISDVDHYETRKEYSKKAEQQNEVRVKAKQDLYRKDEGYWDSEEKIHIESNKEEVDAISKIIGKGVMQFSEPLFLSTNKGQMALTQPLPSIKWRYNKKLGNWNGSTLTLPEEEGVEYKTFYLTPDLLDSLYKIDYYEPIAPGTDVPFNLNEMVGILIKLKNSSVVEYNILNSEVKEWQTLTAQDLNGDIVFRYQENALTEYLPIPGTTELAETKGHIIQFKWKDMEEIDIKSTGHSLIRVSIGSYKQELDYNQSSQTIHLKDLGEVELQVFGTDLFDLELSYKTKIRF